MTPTSFHSITDIPELLLLVAERLEPRDIARCMATCKVLARSLEPLFWKHVIINEKWPPKEAMLRHRHTTRTLSIQSDTCNEKYLETLEQRLETLQQHLKVLVQDVPDPHQCQLDSITDTGQEIQVFRLQRIEMMLFGALGPSLEKMNGPRLWGTYGPALVEMVQSNCPNLRHLAADMFWSEEWEVQSIITMIQACRHAGLESFRFNCAVQRGGSPPHQAALFDELITHHAATLQVIENENGRWRRECQLRLMETCPNLRRLWFDPNILASSYAMLFCIQVVEREWVCLHLKELVLNYSLKISRVKETRALYKQLGRLVHLEVLAIGRIPNKSKKFRDMTLSDGYLGMLAGLNKMRDFHVSKAMWDNLGPEEVAFIKQEWPQLQRVSFGCSKEQFNEIRVQDHWARLCEERPWIKLSRGYQP
ncbi:hypothetical protein BGX31_009938 [Mortierella sp. GBA43]|nr:hypothetical protein BGX31_009938 [Mortierella sp. GBA43]